MGQITGFSVFRVGILRWVFQWGDMIGMSKLHEIILSGLEHSESLEN